jgi:serine/threonine protein kinase
MLKSIPADGFSYFQGLYSEVRSSPYLRVSVDSIPDQSMFAYKYFKDHLLSFTQNDAPLSITKRILRDALRGIAALHDKDIVHTDIKANNIIVEWRQEQDKPMFVEQVQVADIEDAAYVPANCAIVGRQVGNWMWRSPEAHASGQVQKPSDMFSFGVVVRHAPQSCLHYSDYLQCIYAVTKQLIFAVADEELAEGEERLSVVLTRQLSYFSDFEGLEGLLQHLGDSPWAQVFIAIAEAFGRENPRKPIALWKNILPDFKDLVGQMMNVDPKRRLTAHEALAHPWFSDVS